MAMKPRFVLDLEEADRVLLEAHRVRLGCRSHAEALRVLIRTFGKRTSQITYEPGLVMASGGGGSTVNRVPPEIQQEMAATHFGPVRPKPGSRLKGAKKP
jgi:hypothetical protein